MKTVTALLPTTCIVLSGLVAMTGNDGWGWFLAIGFVIWSST